MRENDKPLGSFGHRFLNGWSKVFGQKQDNKSHAVSPKHDKTLKPFPANHFFSIEELSFLAKNQEQCTLLERWALQLSLWAKSMSNDADKNNPQFFPAVQWQDGLMSTWIDAEARPDDIDQQADRLYQLQLEGYELSADFIRMIEARACRSLVSTLFICEETKEKDKGKEQNRFLWVRAVVDKPGEDLTLVIYCYNKVSHSHVAEKNIPYKDFKELINQKAITAFSNEAQRKWHEQATERDKAEKFFNDLVSLIQQQNISHGIFPAYHSFAIPLEEGETASPNSWSLSDNKIKIEFTPQVSIDRKPHFITADNAYQYVDVLMYIMKTINAQDESKDLLTFIRVFGKDFSGDKVLSSQKPFCKIEDIEIDCITAKASDTIVAFNKLTLDTVSLSTENRKMLLKAVISSIDKLLKDLRHKVEQPIEKLDKTEREAILKYFTTIFQGLSAYDTKEEQQDLHGLWNHILKLFDIRSEEVSMAKTAISWPTIPVTPLSKSHGKEEEVTIAEPQETPKQEGEVIASVQTKTTTPTVVDTSLSLHTSDGYIKLELSPRGRWHTPALVHREAYRAFGKLLSSKLKRQLDNEHTPWVSKSMMIPRDSNGSIYTGTNAFMLALWMEEQGFELPFFITEEEIIAKELGIAQNAESFFILNDEGAVRIYNIAQTTFPITQRRSYESLKLNMIATERRKTSGYQFLDSDAFCKIPLQFDGTPNLSIYSQAEKVIHIAPKEDFESEDDYYRDLAVAMIESTRDIDFDTLRLDSYLFENLVSHLGSGIISQSCRFDATNPEYSKIWRERLENNPEYTQQILEQSETSSNQILQATLS